LASSPTFYYDLGSPACYMAAERIMSELPVVPEWEPVLWPDVAGPASGAQVAARIVPLDLAIVRRAPALLLDRRHALAVQLTERDVRLPRRRLRRKRQPDRDIDQSEAD